MRLCLKRGSFARLDNKAHAPANGYDIPREVLDALSRRELPVLFPRPVLTVRGGVSLHHRTGSPTHLRHQAVFGTTTSKPVVCGGVAEPVRMNVLDTRSLSEAFEKLT